MNRIATNHKIVTTLMYSCMICVFFFKSFFFQCFQLHLGVESIRAPELLFQPSMIGSSEAGITETIDYVLKQFSPDEQLLLSQNIFVTGGCANFEGEYKLKYLSMFVLIKNAFFNYFIVLKKV